MRIITISREFGSGGRELGKRLSDALHWDYYDKEIITAVAKNIGVAEDYAARALENHGWRNVPLTFRRSFSGTAAIQRAQTALLVEQKRVIEEIAALGKHCIIVGRNADVLLEAYAPLRFFICADMAARVTRCTERAAADEHLSPREMERRIKNVDKGRAQTREILTDRRWGDPHCYHLTVNTTGRSIRELIPAVAAYANDWFGGCL